MQHERLTVWTVSRNTLTLICTNHILIYYSWPSNTRIHNTLSAHPACKITLSARLSVLAAGDADMHTAPPPPRPPLSQHRALHLLRLPGWGKIYKQGRVAMLAWVLTGGGELIWRNTFQKINEYKNTGAMSSSSTCSLVRRWALSRCGPFCTNHMTLGNNHTNPNPTTYVFKALKKQWLQQQRSVELLWLDLPQNLYFNMTLGFFFSVIKLHEDNVKSQSQKVPVLQCGAIKLL